MAYLGHVPPLRPLQGTGELTNDNSSFCLTAQPAPPPSACTNVWARPLASGSTALGWINNGGADVNVTCDSACLAAAGRDACNSPPWSCSAGLAAPCRSAYAGRPALQPHGACACSGWGGRTQSDPNIVVRRRACSESSLRLQVVGPRRVIAQRVPVGSVGILINLKRSPAVV